MKVHLSKITSPLKGHIELAGSKSISNRLLIIQALCEDEFIINGIATADDTQVLQKVLADKNYTYDVHHAGTSYRFLTSYLCLLDGQHFLTGSSRMKERPIGPLVDALIRLGATIDYDENKGFPPLNIGTANWKELDRPLKIDATISSQFISSLLLIAPYLPFGLSIELEGNLVSRPYLEMTLGLMLEFGVSHTWEGNIISIGPQKYQAKNYTVEADWSAASYYFALVAMVPGSEISLGGLRQNSIQGDSAIVEIMKDLGVETTFTNGNTILKNKPIDTEDIEINFLLQPDLAQTVSVTCAGLGITGLFSGLQTLKVKETDRISALQNELQKIQVFLSKLPSKFSKNSDEEYYIQEGELISETAPSFPTYKDHRMAMAFACLAAKTNLIIEEAEVVSKSYGDFWKDLENIGIVISKE